MESLKNLFDFQRFSPHKGLSDMVSEAASRYGISKSIGIELSDDEMMLNAAGEENIPEVKKD